MIPLETKMRAKWGVLLTCWNIKEEQRGRDSVRARIERFFQRTRAAGEKAFKKRGPENRGLRSATQTVLAYFCAKGGSGDPEKPAGVPSIPVREPQDVLDVLFLHFLEGGYDLLIGFRPFFGFLAQVRKGFREKDFSVAEDHGARQHVLEFADISGPIVVHERLHDVRRDAGHLAV